MDHNLSQAIDYLNSEKEVTPYLFRCDSCDFPSYRGVYDPKNILHICDECLSDGSYKEKCYCEDTEEQIEEQRKQFLKI